MTKTNNNRHWTTQKLIHFSRSLEQAYGMGLNNAGGKSDAWTTAKFIDMSRNLSSAYGVDF